MRIAQVCPYDYGSLGGVQTHIRQLAVELSRRGHSVKIVAPRGSKVSPPEVIEAGGCRQVRFSGTAFEMTWVGLRELLRLRRRLEAEAFEVLHFHTVWNPFMPLQLLLTTTVPCVATFHDTAPDTRLGKLLARTLMPMAAAVLRGVLLDRSIAVSPSPLAHLTVFYRGRIDVIPNGVRMSDFAPGSVAPLSRYRDGKLNLLYLGRLEERKGVLYLLRAYASVKSRHPDLRLLLAGGGHLRPRLERFIRDNRLQDVELLGPVDEQTKRRLYATCDLYCSAAVAGESFGIVLLEAMASGKPAVGARNSGYPWVLTGEGEQLLVPPRDVDALTRKLEQLVEDESLRARLGAWGVAEAAQYDWSKVTSRILRVYEEAVGSH